MRGTFLAVGLAVLWLQGCASRAPEAVAIVREAASAGKPIDLRGVAEGKWDRLIVFAPYTTEAAIRETIGASWDGAGKSGIAGRDDVCLLVFARGTEVVASAEIPRSVADFAKVKGAARDGAVFGFEPGSKVVAVRPGR